MALSEANLQAQATWNNRACGTLSESENEAAGTLETFNRLVERRYGRNDPWVPIVLDFPSMKGKEVLEIGHGQGCDLLHAAMAGGHVHGIDLTPNHHEICKRYFAALKRPVDLHLGNAGELPFASESMDIVYSLGVLHHTDNTVRCIGEAYRVLKPGGTFKIALYHFWSLPHLWLLMAGIIDGNLRRLGYRRLLSRIEGGADGVEISPLVKLYSARQLRTILGDFSNIDISIHGLAYDRIPLVGRFIPKWFGGAVERRWGWYVVANAKK
ncbi:class I SAM-dependent methyltransferase [Bradyrhizobium sp.]|uniref:class I SAM-dependent methyltransferase n=1 Tax=Bradyrhizobium sp. TaxID=376 RepID=UPI0023A5FD3F|nr:class I SAM-dependent methyltransferase [Bradyrhizobium sp.]MDE2376696.1 class I SAM-dependent methyltransferase [Bradyrhizobium sp.]